MKREYGGLLPLLLTAFALAAFFAMFPVSARAEAVAVPADAAWGENAVPAENGGDPDAPADGVLPGAGGDAGESAEPSGSFTLVIAAIIAVAAVILILLMLPGNGEETRR
ncbi:MAG: hypothetical protein IJR89_01130 [Clostridia bacterium]|nr:hypothetical protein [Clostridia bacterium]